jgi:alpha-maltose-1-phosphate synthase
MRIGYLLQAGVPDIRARPLSGAANHVKHIFDELCHLGHRVRLLARLDNQLWKSDDLENFEPVINRWLDQGPIRLFESGVRRLQYELQLPYAALFESLRFALACRQEIADVDLFYERMGWMGYGGGLAARWMKKPLVLEVNGDHLDEFDSLSIPPRGIQRSLSIALMKRAAHRASFAVTTGEGWRQRHIDRWEVDPDRVSVVENGSRMVDLLGRAELRFFESQDVAPETVTIIYAGAFEPWHGLDVLLKATAAALQRNVKLSAVLVGAGTEEDNLRRLTQDLGITDCVIFTGSLDENQLARQLARADIGVSPYCGRVEYSGLKLLDYKAAGLAIIASGEKGQPRVIEHGRTGWIVPPCDSNALSQAIELLACDAEFRRKLGREARIEAERMHTWKHTAQELGSVFTVLLEANSQTTN